MEFPKEVVKEVGFALYLAQMGGRYRNAKPYRGNGSGVFEILSDYDKNAYRAVYKANMDEAIYVVHCFQKKSKRGIKTPREEVEIIQQRLKLLRAEMRKRQ